MLSLPDFLVRVFFSLVHNESLFLCIDPTLLSLSQNTAVNLSSFSYVLIFSSLGSLYMNVRWFLTLKKILLPVFYE